MFSSQLGNSAICSSELQHSINVVELSTIYLPVDYNTQLLYIRENNEFVQCVEQLTAIQNQSTIGSCLNCHWGTIDYYYSVKFPRVFCVSIWIYVTKLN